MISFKKFQEQFQQKMFSEIDKLFPINKSKERENVLMLSVLLSKEFQNILKEIKIDIQKNNTK